MIGGTDLATLRYSEETHWPWRAPKRVEAWRSSTWMEPDHVELMGYWFKSCCGMLWLLTIHDVLWLYYIIYIVHGCDCDHDMGHNEAISPSISSRSAESAISSPCWGTLGNDGCWSTLLLHTTMLYIAISCWDMLRPLSIGFWVPSSGDCSEHLKAGNETCAEAWGQGAVALVKAT